MAEGLLDWCDLSVSASKLGKCHVYAVVVESYTIAQWLVFCLVRARERLTAKARICRTGNKSVMPRARSRKWAAFFFNLV